VSASYERLSVEQIDVCLCCQIVLAIDQNGVEHEVGLFQPRCVKCYRFIEIDKYKYINQGCLNCQVEYK
jgi:hypothetical protein